MKTRKEKAAPASQSLAKQTPEVSPPSKQLSSREVARKSKGSDPASKLTKKRTTDKRGDDLQGAGREGSRSTSGKRLKGSASSAKRSDPDESRATPVETKAVSSRRLSEKGSAAKEVQPMDDSGLKKKKRKKPEQKTEMVENAKAEKTQGKEGEGDEAVVESEQRSRGGTIKPSKRLRAQEVDGLQTKRQKRRGSDRRLLSEEVLVEEEGVAREDKDLDQDWDVDFVAEEEVEDALEDVGSGKKRREVDGGTTLKEKTEKQIRKKKKKKQVLGEAEANAADEQGGVIYVGHIPHGFYEDEMRQYFSQYGEVTKVKVSRSKKTARSKGYGFVEFSSNAVAEIAAKSMHGYLMFGQILDVHVVPPHKIHPELFQGVNRKFRKVPWALIHRKQHNRERSEDDLKKQRQRLVLKERQKREKLAAMGITYDFSGYEGDAERQGLELAIGEKSPKEGKRTSFKTAAEAKRKKAKGKKTAEKRTAPTSKALV